MPDVVLTGHGADQVDLGVPGRVSLGDLGVTSLAHHRARRVHQHGTERLVSLQTRLPRYGKGAPQEFGVSIIHVDLLAATTPSSTSARQRVGGHRMPECRTGDVFRPGRFQSTMPGSARATRSLASRVEFVTVTRSP